MLAIRYICRFLSILPLFLPSEAFIYNNLTELNDNPEATCLKRPAGTSGKEQWNHFCWGFSFLVVVQYVQFLNCNRFMFVPCRSLKQNTFLGITIMNTQMCVCVCAGWNYKEHRHSCWGSLWLIFMLPKTFGITKFRLTGNWLSNRHCSRKTLQYRNNFKPACAFTI